MFNKLRSFVTSLLDPKEVEAQLQRRIESMDYSAHPINRRARRAHEAIMHSGGKPPNSWLRKRRTPGTRKSFMEWIASVPEQYRAQARRYWGSV